MRRIEPQIGDIFNIERNGLNTEELKIVTKTEVAWTGFGGCIKKEGLEALGELKVRDGRPTDWSQFEWRQCPQWYRDRVKQSWKEGYHVESMSRAGVAWGNRVGGTEFCLHSQYRETNVLRAPKKPERSKYKVFELDRDGGYPRILLSDERTFIGAYPGVEINHKDDTYNIFGYTNNADWESGTGCPYEDIPTCIEGNLKYAIGVLIEDAE